MWLVITVLVFLGAQWIYQRKKKAYLLPVFVATLVLIAVLLLFRVPYENYNESAQWVAWLLGPAVVALSYPLYKHRKMLAKNGLKIVSWVAVASLLSVATGAFVLFLFRVDSSYVVTAMLKNITAPVAI